MQLSLQEIFNKSVAGILAQGKQSYGDGHCWYRTAEGLKCAVGVLIPDAKYDASFDSDEDKGNGGTGIRTMVEDDLFCAVLLSEGIDVSDDDVTNLLVKLQSCHDGVPEDADDFVAHFITKLFNKMPTYAEACPALEGLD